MAGANPFKCHAIIKVYNGHGDWSWFKGTRCEHNDTLEQIKECYDTNIHNRNPANVARINQQGQCQQCGNINVVGQHCERVDLVFTGCTQHHIESYRKRPQCGHPVEDARNCWRTHGNNVFILQPVQGACPDCATLRPAQ